MEKISELVEATVTSEEGGGASLPHNMKFNKVLDQFVRKTSVKKYSPRDQNVDGWLSSVMDEVRNIAMTKHLNMSDLTDKQKVQLVSVKLSHEVKAQIEVFCAREETDLDNVSYVKFRELLMKHCGLSVPPVISLMKMFGPERYVKPKEVLMVEHVLGFTDKLPSCLQPGDDIGELKKFRDLIQRTAFYASVGDAEIRKSLIEIPEDKATYSEFTKVAIERSEQLKNNESSQKVVKKIENQQDEAVASVARAEHFQSRGNQKPQRGRGGRGRGSQRGGRGGANKDYSTYTCFICKQVGHIQFKCPNKPQVESSVNGSGSVATRSVDIDLANHFASSIPKVMCVNAFGNSSINYCDRINISLILNGHLQLLFEFDTAAGVSILPKVYLESFAPGKRPILEHCDVKLDLANGQSAEIVGAVNVDVVASNRENVRPVKAKFLVVDGPHALLGRPLIKELFPRLYKSILELSGKVQKCHGDKKYRQLPDSYVVAKNVSVVNKSNSASGQSTKSENVCSKDTTAISSDKVSPEKTPSRCCKLLDAPTGNVTQEVGAKYCEKIYKAHPALYDGKQGLIKGIKAKITLKPGAEKHLKVMKPAKVGYAAKEGHREQIDKLLQTSKIVDSVGLVVASQIVPVVTMKEGKLRVRNTVIYKPTLNPWIEDEPYNFPTIEDQIEKLDGEYFSCVDIKDAYPHIEVEEESQKYLTISTERGFIQPTRLTQGVKTAPKIFQKFMDEMLVGIPSVACIVDDICITGKTPADHFKNLETVLHKLEENGLKVNPKKCQFYLPEVKYLGRIISKDRRGIP